jgi:DNA polymerase-1
MVLQVHDELLLEVSETSVHAVRDALRSEMEGVASLRVPLRVDFKLGPSWGEMQPMARFDLGSLHSTRSETRQ